MKTLSSILTERYGVTVLSAPVEAILWAAERSIATIGAAAARAELSAANRTRERAGRMPAYPAYGSVLFGGVR